MAITTTNLTQGPAEVWVGAFGVTEPATAGATPGVGWTNVGATDGGSTMTVGQTYSNMMVDQVAMAVGTRMTEQLVQVKTAMAEATLANLRTALNLAASAGTSLEIDSAITNADPNYAAVMLIGQRPGGGPRLVIVRRCLSTENVEMAFQKDNKTMIPVTFTAFYVSASVKALKIDDTP